MSAETSPESSSEASSETEINIIPFPLPRLMSQQMAYHRHKVLISRHIPAIAVYTTLNISRARLHQLIYQMDAYWQAKLWSQVPPDPRNCKLAIPGDPPSDPSQDEKFAFPKPEGIVEIMYYHFFELRNMCNIPPDPPVPRGTGFAWDYRGFLVITNENLAEYGVWVVWWPDYICGEELYPEMQLLAARVTVDDAAEVMMFQQNDGRGMQNLYDNYDLEKYGCIRHGNEEPDPRWWCLTEPMPRRVPLELGGPILWESIEQ